MKDSLTLWSERPEFRAYNELNGLPKSVAAVLILSLIDQLGGDLEVVASDDLREIVAVCTTFSQQVYGPPAQPRMEALGEIPPGKVGDAFRAVERLVQPNGFP